VSAVTRRGRAMEQHPTEQAAGDDGLGRIERWFASRGWTPFEYQRRAWAASRDGASGLIHVPTGAGKTYAAYLGPLSRVIDALPRAASPRGHHFERGLRILFVTPLRAVARDCELALRQPIDDLELPLKVGSRTGDTPARERASQRERLPEVLVTTPESLSLLLCRPTARALFERLDTVIVDEWHELMPTKRGVQTELALARLRRWRPELRIWALSATLAKPQDAARQLVGVASDTSDANGARHASATRGASAAPRPREATVIEGGIDRPVRVTSLLPESIERMPWSGHMGMAMLEPLCDRLDPAVSTLIFTNTRSQAERWFAEITRVRPEWHGRVALHHGSIDQSVRRRVEAGIKSGAFGIVVATSSLDLGVDFAPVERVVQIGSPKGIARLLQRAGRSAHRPGAACEVLCVPTHAMELFEIAAARQAIARGEIESRPGGSLALDCLVQHLVTIATGGGFIADELFDEVRTAHSFRNLERSDFNWALSLVTDGGRTLGAYERFRRVRREPDGMHRVRDARVARSHRLNVGTITSEAVLTVAMAGGRRLGSIEEDFILRLSPGDAFVFAGRTLEFVRVHEMRAIVRRARKRTTLTPRWAGSRFPLSTALSFALRRLLDAAAHGENDEPEVEAARSVLDAQARLSRIPRSNETLIESCTTEEGQHVFIYPFEGRLVHEGLGALLALRLGRLHRATFVITMNDYGIELLTSSTHDFASLMAERRELYTTDGLVEDLRAAANAGELSSRQFREIARIAGLVPQRDVYSERLARQIQASASLLFEVFRDFEPSNPLLQQSEREVLDRHFEEGRLARTLERLAREPRPLVRLSTPGPLSFPLVAARIGTTALSTETLRDRLAAIVNERAAAVPRRRRRVVRSAV